MPEVVTDAVPGATDYRLNLLGVRVRRDTCQLISRSGDEWLSLGPRWRLPITVPQMPAELALAPAVAVTAYQFCHALPEAGLAEILTQTAPQKRPGPPKASWRAPRVTPLPAIDRKDHVASSLLLMARSMALLERGGRKFPLGDDIRRILGMDATYQAV